MTAGSADGAAPDIAADATTGRYFRILWAGQAVSQFGDEFGRLALPTVALLTLHAGPGNVGGLIAMVTAANGLLGIPIGLLADRFRRRPLMIVADVARFALTLYVPVAAALGWLDLLQLYIVAFWLGAGRTLFDVSYQSYLPSLVDGGALTKANSNFEATGAVAQAAGPAVGGAVMQAAGAAAGFLADSVSFLVSAVSLALVRRPEAPRPAVVPGRLRASIAEGFATIYRDPVLRGLTTVSVLGNVARVFTFNMFLVYAYQSLRLSPTAVGVLLAVGAVGAFAGSRVSRSIAPRFGVLRACRFALIATAVPWMFAPLVTSHRVTGTAVAGAMMLLAGFSTSMWNIVATTMRQQLVPAAVLGRVMATNRTISWGVIPFAGLLAALAVGWSDDLAGPVQGPAYILVIGAMVRLASLLFLPSADGGGGIRPAAGAAPVKARLGAGAPP